jgi:nanoRNase/pAp phosphatase (c-di-AMP/oligoRNAs hydrolase)
LAAPDAQDVARLKEVLEPYSRVLVLTHNNPDPDALAAAAGIRLLVARIAHKPATICYAGFLSRAENREMVRDLRLPVHDIEHVDLRRFRAVILVDTQPGAGNNALAARHTVAGAIDHHPRRAALRDVPFCVVDSEAGATSTLVYELLKAADVKPPANIATALFFGIKTDTQDLGREAAGRDLSAYKELFGLALHRRLALIMHPRKPAAYYRTVSAALASAVVYGDCVYAPMGEVPTPEYVSEIADYISRLEGMRWAVATGVFQGDLYFSLRTLSARKDGGSILRRAIGSSGVAGGHQRMAGGRVDLKVLDPQRRDAAQARVLSNLFQALGAATASPIPLLAPLALSPAQEAPRGQDRAEAPVPEAQEKTEAPS